MAASHISTRHPSAEVVTTSFLLGNLHCPTCVSTIKDIIKDSCADHVRWVSPNVVTSVVTVEHSIVLSIEIMQKALEDGGFEVCGVATSARGEDSDLVEPRSIVGRDGGSNESAARPASTFSRWGNFPRIASRSQAAQSSRARAHLQNCEQCRNSAITGRVTEHKASEPTLAEQPSSSTMSSYTLAPRRVPAKMSSNSFITADADDVSVSPPSTWSATLAVGGMTCASCANSITNELNKRDWISKVAVNLVTNSATVELNDKEKANDLVEAIEDLGFEATLDSVVNLSQEKPITREQQDSWRATLAIGGMTCASCANAISEELKKKDWISNFAVNLVSNSATVEFSDRKNIDQIVSVIEDLGYEAAVDTVINIAQESNRGHARTVEVQIQGLYCEHCPDRVTNSLAGFRRQLDVLQQPTLTKPIIKLSYTPDAPAFTIREILAAIEASDPEFKATIYHPPTLEERSKQIMKKHQRQLLYRVIFTGIVCIPTFVIGIVYMSLLPSGNAGQDFIMAPWTSGISRAQMALFIMASPVYFFTADVFHVRAFKEIRTLWRRSSKVPIIQRFYRFGSMNTLMSLGTTIAYISSVSQLIAAAVYQPDQINDSNFYFDSVVFLTFFLLVGRLIESYSKSKTGDAVEMLGKLRPTTAILVVGHGSEKEHDSVVKVDRLDFGDIVRITHGGSPPADGTVVRGDSNFDESSLTGESRLVKKAPGDEVFAGTVNKGSPLLARITGVSGQSMLDQIVKVVREGQTKRAPMERIADLLTTYFVPVVTLVAILTWVLWMSLGFSGAIPGHYLDVTSGGWVAFSLQFAISVFVVACPCGLALAAPTAIFVGGGMAAKHGILAKGGGEAFEKASHIDCVVFDKTGTLTEGGEPSITDSETYPDSEDVPEKQRAGLLAALRAVEENSSHPIAKAIVSFCTAQTTDRAQAEEVHEIAGRGMKAAFRGVLEEPFELIVGNEALMQDYGVAMSPKVFETLQKWKTEAKSVALAATKPIPVSDTQEETWTLAAILSISDPIRPEAPAVIRALQGRGTRVWMLSGDNPTTAIAVGKQLGIPSDQVIAGVLPTEKAAKITYLQSTLKARVGGKAESTTRRAMVAMVGDGINDSPALATADVGVAIGSGSDVAISSADFVLVKSDLRSVVTLLDLSSTVFRRIKFNFGWALVYNVLAVPIAAGALYPVKSGGKHVRLDPVWASLAMALSSISVVLSSLALRSSLPLVGFRERKVE